LCLFSSLLGTLEKKLKIVETTSDLSFSLQAPHYYNTYHEWHLHLWDSFCATLGILYNFLFGFAWISMDFLTIETEMCFTVEIEIF